MNHAGCAVMYLQTINVQLSLQLYSAITNRYNVSHVAKIQLYSHPKYSGERT